MFADHPLSRLTPEEIRLLPSSERLLWVRRLRVGHQRWNDMMNKVERCHQFQSIAPEPVGLLLVGPSGVGKTSLVKSYQKKYPKLSSESGTQLPVVYATVPSPSRSDAVRDLPKSILYAMGDPFADKGSGVTMTNRLIGLFKDCGTKLLIWDELKHLYDRENNKLLYNASNWLKTFIKDTEVATVLVGLLGEAEQVVNINPQLSRLFGDPQMMTPFEWDDEFRSLLFDIEQLLPLRELSHLDSDELALRCYVSCDGLISYLMTLIRGAAYLALTQGREHLDRCLLETAFTEFVSSERRGLTNPFVGDLPTPDPSRRQALLKPRSPTKSERRTGHQTTHPESLKDVL